MVFLRTGCLSHVQKYLSFAESTSFPGNTTGDPGTAEAGKDKVISAGCASGEFYQDLQILHLFLC